MYADFVADEMESAVEVNQTHRTHLAYQIGWNIKLVPGPTTILKNETKMAALCLILAEWLKFEITFIENVAHLGAIISPHQASFLKTFSRQNTYVILYVWGAAAIFFSFIKKIMLKWIHVSVILHNTAYFSLMKWLLLLIPCQ